MKKIIPGMLVLAVLASCGRFGNKDNGDHKERIVCLAKQYNEIIFALGAQKDIVAVDISSTYPEAIKTLPTVGYHRALSAEAIIANNPTLIIHDNNIGPEHVVKQLNDLKIPMKTFQDSVVNIERTQSLIREMGGYFHKEKEADSLCQKLGREMETALTDAKRYTDTPKVLIIHFGQAMNIYMALTKKSNAAKMIEWAGGKMPVDGNKGMQPLSPEMIAQADPDVILLTDFGYDRLGSVEKVKELPGIAGTKAARSNHIYRVEEHDMIYLGPRTGANVLAFEKLIHDSTRIRP
ncbi:heme/hemin ABC transporter substrate-binding protein [Taibaiella soli]|uniref:ABC transporter substrate-binding protein n=1 Tax=Taibaiella soli TaxID=1649169 RepID=A0A2W2AJW7_9BACT|nr:ABC transporter substrate-binding protein [Taibaiella soli]PZF72530.1 ABC transporter substrate-binding protein [Taibaiella soli]